MKPKAQAARLSRDYTDYPYLKQEWLDRFEATAFIQGCRSGSITRETMHVFIRQQLFYSRGFTRYLAALLANIENENHRLVLAEILFEEMGGIDDRISVSHAALYRKMMASMGIEAGQEPHPATQYLVTTMFNCCKSANYMVGLGALCLGVEAVVPYLYSAIIEGFRGLGESEDHLSFFRLHLERDPGRHAALYRIIDGELDANPGSWFSLNYGAEKVIQARIAFFESLTPA